MTFAVGSGPPGGSGAGHQPFGISNVLSSLFSLYISPQTPPPHSRCIYLVIFRFFQVSNNKCMHFLCDVFACRFGKNPNINF
jgi:hypothetical protein